MGGRKGSLLSFENVCVLFYPLSKRSDTWAPLQASEEPKTDFSQHPAFHKVARDT